MPATKISKKTNRIEAYLRDRITSGKWKSGEKLPTVHELGDIHGISYMTVRKAMDFLARDGLVVRKKRAGTFVADKILSKKSVAILTQAKVLASAAGFYYHHLIEDASKLISESGYRPVVHSGLGDSNQEIMDSVHLFDPSVAGQTIGVIFLGRPDEALIKACRDHQIPLVGILAGSPCEDVPSVVIDYKDQIQRGLGALMANGISDYVMMHVSPAPEFSSDYKKVFSPILNEIGVPPERMAWLPFCGVDYSGVYDEFKKYWFSLDIKPAGIFFLSDVVCTYALSAILELGIDIPGELKIITISNEGRRFPFFLPITRMEISPREIISNAWEMLDTLINGKELDCDIRYVKSVFKVGKTLGEFLVAEE